MDGGTAWRLAEIPGGTEQVVARLGSERSTPVDVPVAPVTGPAGAVTQDDGRTALVAVVPLGRLTAAQADLLAATARNLQLTPWRSVVLPDLPDASAARHLAAAGLVIDPGSSWLRVTACAGRPGCAKSLADVRADAATAVATGTLPSGGARQHWAGCERRCGRPRGDVTDVVATGLGYRVGAPLS
jgi:precorrin-3B synthase